MNYFDRMVNVSYFRKYSDGFLIFFPYGQIGDGYIIPSDAEYKRLFRTYRALFIIDLLLAVPMAVLCALATWAGLIFLCAILLPYVILPHIQCRDLERTTRYVYTTYGKPNTNKKYTFLTRAVGKYVEPAMIILTGFLAIIFTIANASIEDLTTVWVLFSSACAALITRKVMERYREKRMHSIKYRRQNSYASDQLSLTLSVRKLSDTSPEVAGLRGLRNRIRWKLNGKWNFIDVLKEHIYYGDSQPAIVMNVDPLFVAVYSDDLDCVAILQFPIKLVKKYSLQIKSQLISINTYMQADKYQSDLVPGPHEYGRWKGFFSVIADFVSDDKGAIEKRKRDIKLQHWDYVYRLGLEYIHFYPNVWRDGNPFNSRRVLHDIEYIPNNILIGSYTPHK